MIKIKDGYAKLVGTTASGSASHILLSNGSIKAVSDFAMADGTNATGTWNIDISGNAKSSTQSKYLLTGAGTECDANTLAFSDHLLRWYSSIPSTSSNLPTVTGWQNGLLALPLHSNGVTAQLYFSCSKALFYRSSASGDWKQIAFTDQIPTVTNYYWANIKVSNTSSTTTTPTFGKIKTAGIENTGHYSWLANTNFKCIPTANNQEWSFDLGNISYDNSNNSSYTGTYLQIWSVKHRDSIASFHNDTRYVGINTTAPSFPLHINGDSYASGWSRAANGFYIHDTGVHFTRHNVYTSGGEINLTSGNEFMWGANTAELYFNYRTVSRGTTVTSFIWNAGSATTYANHTLGSLTSKGNLTMTSGYIWVQGGSAAGGNSNRLTTTTGMPGNMQYNVSRRGTQIYSNGIAFADPYNGNNNNDSGWIRHIETTANTSILEIATGDDGDASEEIRFRGYNTSNTINYDILVPKASGTLALVGQSYTKSEADSRFLLRRRMTNPSDGTAYQGAIPYALALKSAGTPLYGDPEFASGTNNCMVYNNSGNSTVAVSRIADNQGSANSSGYILQIVNNGGTSSPGRGGFYQNISARQNAVFAQIFRAKIPTGFNVYNAENHMGNGYTTYWLTDTAGTGKWEWYIRITICGSGGTYSNGGHVYLNGSGAVTWYLSYCNVIDLTRGSQDGLRSIYSRYVVGDNNAASPGYSLLQSGSGRADASPGGDTWIYWDTLGGTASPWGILHEQYSNYISFYGAGNRRSFINLSDGCVYGAHFYENSDIRYKTIINNIAIKANQLANLPLFDFKWQDNENQLNTGTSAQAVQELLPYIVSGTDKLTLDYGVLGTIAGITACKELTEQEKEINKLKEQIKFLKDEINNLKTNKLWQS